MAKGFVMIARLPLIYIDVLIVISIILIAYTYQRQTNMPARIA
jgi:low temperature requirement protein LtrA